MQTQEQWLALQSACCRCGLTMARCPWQMMGALALCMACAWICPYMGLTLLAAIFWFAAQQET